MMRINLFLVSTLGMLGNALAEEPPQPDIPVPELGKFFSNWRASLSLGGGYDDNVLVRPEDGAPPPPPDGAPPPPPGAPPPADAPPPPMEPAAKDGFTALKLRLKRDINPHAMPPRIGAKQNLWGWTGNAELRAKDYAEESAADEIKIKMMGGPVLNRGRSQTALTLGYEYIRIDGSSLLNEYLLDLTQSWAVQSDWRAGFRIERGERKFSQTTQSEELDGSKQKLLGQLTNARWNNWALRLEAGVSQQDTEVAARGFDSKLVTLELQRAQSAGAMGQARWRLKFKYEDSEYNGADPFLGEPRSDIIQETELSIHKPVSQHWGWYSQYKYTDADSNVPPFDFHRNTIELGASRRF